MLVSSEDGKRAVMMVVRSVHAKVAMLEGQQVEQLGAAMDEKKDNYSVLYGNGGKN